MKLLRFVSSLINLLATLESRQVDAALESPLDSPGQNTALSLEDVYDGYGEDWIFIPDGDGNPQVAILKESEIDIRAGLDDHSVSYILYTKSNPENGTMLFLDDPDSLRNSDFSPSRKTKFITHGWKSSTSSIGFTNMKEAYLNHGDYNIIMVDWKPLASSIFYIGPVRNTRLVGADAGKFIDYLVNETSLSTKDVHFIGHSLGAHVAGIAGTSVKSGTLSRITGLDPALPGFKWLASIDSRLDDSDADFVDVIHSCGGIMGWMEPLGHADFYPNGGVAAQPGCCCLPEVINACSHSRAYAYFTESINSGTGLLATQCDSWDNYKSGKCSNGQFALMGEHVERSANGSYFLRTNSEAPYGYINEKETIIFTQ